MKFLRSFVLLITVQSTFSSFLRGDNEEMTVPQQRQLVMGGGGVGGMGGGGMGGMGGGGGGMGGGGMGGGGGGMGGVGGMGGGGMGMVSHGNTDALKRRMN